MNPPVGSKCTEEKGLSSQMFQFEQKPEKSILKLILDETMTII